MKMEMSVEEVVLIRRYLLGELAEDDRDPIEVRLLADPQYFSQLDRVEDELTDQYVRRELSQHERELFENHFLNARERRENVVFTQALHRYVSTEAMAKPGASLTRAWKAFLANWSPQWRVARNASLACAALILIGVVTWPLVEAVRFQRRLAEVETEQAESRRLEQDLKRQLDEQRSHSEDLARQLESSHSRLAQMDRRIASLPKAAGSTRPEAGEIIAMALGPGMGRDAAGSAQERTVDLPPGASRLRLELGTVDSGLSRYRAEVKTDAGDLVWSREALRESSTRIGKAVVITLPVSLLTKNAYLIVLSGAAAGRNYEKIGTYYFEIKR